jgi:hypothetical protein
MAVRTITAIVFLSLFGRFAFPQAKYEPPDGFVYHGVGWGDAAQAAYAGIFPESQQPLMVQVIVDLPGGPRPFSARQLLSRMDAVQTGQAVELSVQLMQNGKAVDSVFAGSAMFDWCIDTLAWILRQHGRPVFLRIGLEANGPWNGYTPWHFPAAFRKMVLGLRGRGIEKIATVWCYEPDAEADFADSTQAGWKWYPGDDAVDWFGLDLFDADHFHPDLPDSTRGGLTKKGRSGKFLAFAGSRKKPVYLNELSARGMNITGDAVDPGGLDGKKDWEGWFKPFFRFLELHPVVKAFNYIDLDWTKIPQYATWGDARIEINTVIRNGWNEALSAPRFLHAGNGLFTTAVRPHPRRPEGGVPGGFSVFPNPSNASVTIHYILHESMTVAVHALDLRGRTVGRIDAGWKTAGVHRVVWDASGCPGGVYVIRWTTPSKREIHKVLLVK